MAPREAEQPVPIPDHLFKPIVEDWVSPEDDGNARATYLPGPWLTADEQQAWHLEEVATERWRRALHAWRASHPRVDMPIAEYRLWTLYCSPGGLRATWRDRKAFLSGLGDRE